MKYIFLLLLTLSILEAAGQSGDQPRESRPDIFTYFNPLAPNPTGAATASKGIVHISDAGTAFLIRTFRDDHKVCMCMTSHQALGFAGLHHGTLTPDLEEPLIFNRDILMNYLGEDSISNGEHYNRITRYSKAFLHSAILLDYADERYHTLSNLDDAALLLVDEEDLPTDSYTAFGYDFRDDQWSDPFYMIGHPLYYPQRITDNMRFNFLGISVVYFSIQPPYATSQGSSGSPLLTRSGNIVRGIHVRGDGSQSFIGHQRSTNMPYRYPYSSNTTVASKLMILESAIREHCWKKDSADVASSGSYMKTVTVDNSWVTDAYNKDASLTDPAKLTTPDASIFTESAANVTTTRLNAKNCSINGFTLPVTNPSTNNSWQVSIAAKQIDVSSGFDYTPSGQSSLLLSTVVISPSAVGAMNRAYGNARDTIATDETDKIRLKIYPSPSSTGVFNISVPTGISDIPRDYQLQVISSDGRIVYKGKIQGGTETAVDIHSNATGTYFVIVTDNKGTIVFREPVVYGG